jgi:protein O-GlcNAc transferase
VPLVTLSGATFQSRVAASLLVALGLPQLVTTTLDDYHALASRLARDPQALAALRARLERARKESDLFSGAAIARKLERAYDAMWRLYVAGEPPQHIDLG